MYGFRCICVPATLAERRRRRHKRKAICRLPCQVDLKIPVNHRKGSVKITNWNVVLFESSTVGSAAYAPLPHTSMDASLHPGQQVRAAGKARCVPAVTCCVFISPLQSLFFYFSSSPIFSMSDTSHPAFQAAPAAGPPRSIRIGSLCENYIIWTALTQGDCVNVRARFESDVFTPCAHKLYFASKVTETTPSHSSNLSLDTSALDATASDWNVHVCCYLGLFYFYLISLRLIICACCAICIYSSVVSPHAQVRGEWRNTLRVQRVLTLSAGWMCRLTVMHWSHLLKNTELVRFVFLLFCIPVHL